MKLTNLSFKQHLALCIFFSLILAFIIQMVDTVYSPLTIIVTFSFLYGFMEPKKGYILTLTQITILIVSYFIFNALNLPQTNHKNDAFVTIIATGASLACSFVGSLIAKM